MFPPDFEPIVEKNVLKINKLVPEAVVPKKANQSDAGLDCIALNDGTWNNAGTYIEYKIGIAIQLPEGYHVELFPRSSVSKYDLVLCNSVGLVDNGYRGEIVFRFKYVPRMKERKVQLDGDGGRTTTVHEPAPSIIYQKGDKVGQIVIRKTYDFPVIEVSELSETERGTGGFGSSGN